MLGFYRWIFGRLGVVSLVINVIIDLGLSVIKKILVFRFF